MLFFVLVGVCLIFVARQLLLQRRIAVRHDARSSREAMISGGTMRGDDNARTGGRADDA